MKLAAEAEDPGEPLIVCVCVCVCCEEGNDVRVGKEGKGIFVVVFSKALMRRNESVFF